MNIYIPKRVYFYWGGKSLSFLRYLSIYSFAKYNPNYKIEVFVPTTLTSNRITWNSGEQAQEYVGVDYFPLLKNIPNLILHEANFYNLNNELSEVHKSDILRLNLLSSRGGVWSDIDILYLDSIDNIIGNETDTMLSYNHNAWLIGFLAATPNNPVFLY